MNILWLLAVLVLTAPGSKADPSPAAAAFLEVPDTVWSWKHQEQAFHPADLPVELRQMVHARPGGGTVPVERFSGFSLDLNGDRSPEYFLRSALGGTGGPHYFIYSKRDGQWSTIGSFQGGFHLLKEQNGWNPIIGFSSGGDSCTMFRLDFRGDQYDEVWMAHFDAGQVIPPQTLFSHRAWCDDARSPEERLQRLEGFWEEYLPVCDGGSNRDREEYEDAPHISSIRGTAYELALAYTSAGRREEARKIIEWLRWSDQLELWSDLPNPLTGTSPSLPEESGEAKDPDPAAE